MNNYDIAYSLLEMTYADLHGINLADENFHEKVKDILPNDWYSISTEEQVRILEDAIKNKIPVENCDTYKNRYPKDAQFYLR